MDSMDSISYLTHILTPQTTQSPPSTQSEGISSRPPIHSTLQSMRLAPIAILLLLCPLLHADDDWGALQFIIGSWTGEGGGGPGQGTGSFSFQPDVQGKVLVRRNHSEYPAAKDRPAVVHDDLMIVYRESDESAEGALRAIFFDNEQHVIRYAVTMFGDKVVFTSEANRGAPRYRFTYTRVSADALRIKFEIAPPGKDFATYIEAGARRAR